METYCKIFVHSTLDRPALLQQILTAISASQTGIRSFENDTLEGEISYNEDYDPGKSADPEEGFLFYRYYLDIDTKNTEYENYVLDIKSLLTFFKRAEMAATVACDFEAELILN